MTQERAKLERDRADQLINLHRPGAYIEEISAARREGLRREVREFDGLFVGQLSDYEQATFEDAVAAGVAYRSYEGGMGFMGCAKARMR
jgi:hypothetical protein